MRRGRARAIEVRITIRIVIRIADERHATERNRSFREERGVDAVGRGNVRLQSNLWRGQTVVIRVEVNRNRAGRSEVFRQVRPKRGESRYAVSTGRGAVTKGNRRKIVTVLGWSDIRQSVTEEDVLQLIRRVTWRGGVRPSDNHLGLVSREGRFAKLDGTIIGNVVGGKGNAGDKFAGHVEE